MTSTFSNYETSIIRNMMLTKSAKYIAVILEMDTAEIKVLLAALANTAGIISYQQKLDDKLAAKKAATISKTRTKRIRDQRQGAATIEQKKLQRENDRLRKEQLKLAIRRDKESKRVSLYPARRPPNYKTIVVDYTKLVTVRIDRQTMIYSQPGEETATKKKFLEKYVKPIDRI
jgi:hypothetical protein